MKKVFTGFGIAILVIALISGVAASSFSSHSSVTYHSGNGQSSQLSNTQNNEDRDEIIITGTVTSTSSPYPDDSDYICTVKVGKIISFISNYGSEPTCHVGDEVGVYYGAYGEDTNCGTYDQVKTGDEVKVYGVDLLICGSPVWHTVISICGKSSYYLKKIGSPTPTPTPTVCNVKFEGIISKIYNKASPNWYDAIIKVTKVTNDPSHTLYVNNIVTVYRANEDAYEEEVSVNDLVEVCAEYNSEYYETYGYALRDWIHYIQKIEEKKPDLIIQDISWKPKNPSIGDTLTFTVAVRNIGSADSKKCEGWGSISAGSDYDLYYFHYTVPPLAPGEKYEYRTTWKATECGELYVWASANLNMEFEESNEENNWLEKTIYIQCKEKKPDLIIQSISINPENLKPKTFLRFPVTVKNIGDGVADKSIAILFVDGSGLYGLDVDSLSAGSTQTILFDWRTECGNHEIKIFADGFREIKESNEANNNKTKTVYVKCPTKRADLVIQDISWNPSNPKQGDTVTIKTEVKNQGIADAGKFAVYWAINGMCYGRSYIYNLATGATTTTSITWKKDWECGDIALSAIADTDDDILETSEKNNGKSEVMQVKCPPSGLIISNVSIKPKNPIIEDTIEFKITIKNTGAKTVKDPYIQVECWNTDTEEGLFIPSKSCPSLKPGETCSSCKDVQVKGKGKYIVDICIKSKGSHLYKVITFTVSDKLNIDKSYIDFIDSADSFYEDMKCGPLERVTWDIKNKNKLQETFKEIAGDTAESAVINVIIMAVSIKCPPAGTVIKALNTGLNVITVESLTNTIIENFKIGDIEETIKNSDTYWVRLGLGTLESNGDDIKNAYENGKDPVKLLKDRQTYLLFTYDAEIGLDNEIFNYLNQSGYGLKVDDYKEIQSFLSALSLQLDLDYVVTSAVLNTYEDTPVKHISEELNHDLNSHCMPIHQIFRDQMHCFGYLNDENDVDEYKLSIPKEFTPNIEVAGDNLEVTLEQNGNLITNQIITKDRYYYVLKKHASGIYTLKVSRASASPYDLIVHTYKKIGDNYYPSVEPIERIPI